MKKIYFAFALIASLSSCSAPIVKPRYIKDVYIFDYSKYADKGFFFSESNSVNFNYIPIGSINAYNESGYEVVSSVKERERNDDVLMAEHSFHTSTTRYGDKLILADRSDLIDEVYKQALKKGANGIINLKFVFTTKNVTISGMAIKK
ncbi:hypothetical protein [Pedobacter frigoris]|uniref:Lipoprotein n=1 Tax=Pedobacter frigoris TaxID=2571272 RepID=A0A4U1CJZ5_9SPHI|nr:hypothetical protein [Pedobacter frigoris]TKC06936.1 hypothetical protein FA047_06605 [Pedobacter frigoris]